MFIDSSTIPISPFFVVAADCYTTVVGLVAAPILQPATSPQQQSVEGGLS